MKQLGDPRCSAYFTAVDGDYYGVPLGITGNLSDYQTKCSPLQHHQVQHPVVWMPAAESFFLRAEAALRWPEFGDAQSFYEAGVKTAMEETGVSIGEYLSSTNTITGYSDPVSGYNYTFTTNGLTPAWDASANFEGKLERIATQKWISLFPTEPKDGPKYAASVIPTSSTPRPTAQAMLSSRNSAPVVSPSAFRSVRTIPQA